MTIQWYLFRNLNLLTPPSSVSDKIFLYQQLFFVSSVYLLSTKFIAPALFFPQLLFWFYEVDSCFLAEPRNMPILVLMHFLGTWLRDLQVDQQCRCQLSMHSYKQDEEESIVLSASFGFRQRGGHSYLLFKIKHLQWRNSFWNLATWMHQIH